MKKLLLLGLGSNLGDRVGYLKTAKSILEISVGIFLAASPIYETEPFGVDHETPFLNQVLAFQTGLTGHDILKITAEIEKKCGRVTKKDLAPRSLDIDILSLGYEIQKSSDLNIPHQAISKRLFVLVPMAAICPNWKHPYLQKTTSELIDALPPTSWIKVWRP